MKLDTQIGLGPGHSALDGDPSPLSKKRVQPQIFGRCLLWPNGRPSQLLLSTCFPEILRREEMCFDRACFWNRYATFSHGYRSSYLKETPKYGYFPPQLCQKLGLDVYRHFRCTLRPLSAVRRSK